MKRHGTMQINNNGNLEIGGCDTLALAKQFGTPLYVMDEALLHQQCNLFKTGFAGEQAETEVAYASKAFLTLEMCRLIKQKGLSLDVVSGGELYTAMKSEFPPQKIYFHGNNKSEAELSLALSYGVGTIVVDHEVEALLLESVCEEKQIKANILLRINPGVSAHTHEYIQTANPDSKFGMFKGAADTESLIERLATSKWLNLKGLHYHIGSQITEESSFFKGAELMVSYLSKLKAQIGFEAQVLNMGGGFGIYYTDEDLPINLQTFLPALVAFVERQIEAFGLTMPKLVIEPGRSIVANAGTTLYTVGAVKNTAGGKCYAFIDGGMTDNPRPALYQAVYEAAAANKMNLEASNLYTIGGKCCESGDVLIESIRLPELERGDVLAVAGTGAYNYSMASHYNRNCKPAVIWVLDGKARVVVKRETYEDLIRFDV